MPEFSLENAFQVAVLIAGTYLVLSLLRTTRGSVLVRAIGIALLVFGVGMYSLVRTLQLSELEQVLDAIFGVVILIGVILFQPELRRGILRLGEQGLLRRFLHGDSNETIGEITAAVARMAPVKQGALIAIERQTPLDEFIDKSVRIDAAVSHQLLDSIFYDKGALHDGAVIIQGDRIVSAAAILPLSEGSGLEKTTGTRHRAALGLAEVTDAVTVVVSEETGWISLAHDGKLLRRISSNALEDELKKHLDQESSSRNPRNSFASALKSLLFDHWGQKLIAMGLGLALFIGAHKKVTETVVFTVEARAAAPGEAVRTIEAGRLAIYPPPSNGGDGTEKHITGPTLETPIKVQVSGPREKMQELVGGIGGVLELTDATATNRPLAASEFIWGSERAMDGLSIEWAADAPQLRLQEFERRKFTPSAEQVPVVRGELPIRLEFDASQIRFRPNELELRGPAQLFNGADGDFALSFAEVAVGEGIGGTWSEPLKLDPALVEQGFALVEPVYVEVDLLPSLRSLGEIQKSVVLISFDPSLPQPETRFEAPDKQVRIKVAVSPLLENPSEEDSTSLSLALRSHLEANTHVFVNVDRLEPGGSNLAKVELQIIQDRSWMEALPPSFKERIRLAKDFPFSIEVHPDDQTLRLVPVEDSNPGPPNSNSNSSD